MSDARLADFRPTPYWWDDVPRPRAAERDPPAEADVVIVGSGYAGLACAIELAKLGREATVVEAKSLGYGASSRSVGMIGGRLRQSYPVLARRFGEAKATALLTETRSAFDWFLDFVAREKIDCDLAQSGRLICAWTAADMDKLARQRDTLATFGIRAEILDATRLQAHIRSPLYRGALLLPDDGGLHPARYHEGLVEAARRRGVRLVDGTAVTGVEKSNGSFVARTSRGPIRARNVVLATNAYTGAAFPWLRRRIIPVGSHMMATAPLSRDAIAAALPGDALVNDTRSLAYAIRKSPDGSRLLVGGRALARNKVDERDIAERLMSVLREALPELPEMRASHAWAGNVGFTLDRIPHVGVHDGVHYVTGCNGSGIVMASHLGTSLARTMADPGHRSEFFGNAFGALPFYSGDAWFMPVVSASMGLADRLRALLHK